ncbi:MAG: type II toxin-antitoxin system Phd/YefM family antitoxin [Pseudomonadota bacterium]
MKKLAAAEAKNKFGQLLDMAQRAPVTIEKKGRPVAVIMSLEDYKHFERFEDQIWAAKAKGAEEEGFLSVEESENFLNEREK